MLRIFEKSPDGGDPVSYLFHFNTSEAKHEAQSVKDVLSRLLADARSGDPNRPRPAGSTTPTQATSGTGASASATMAFASAVNSQQSSSRWFDDQQLKN